MARQIGFGLLTLSVLAVYGCKGEVPATTVYSAEVLKACAGFGAAQAAELLGVSAADVESRFDQVTPTTGGCTFRYRADQTRQVSFSITREDSIEEATHNFASYRETVTISSRVRQSATGEKPAEGAYVDILGVGDEAIWSHTNESLAVRRANLTIMVMSPDDKKQQVAVAQKIIASL